MDNKEVLEIPADLKQMYDKAKNGWQCCEWDSPIVVDLIERVARAEKAAKEQTSVSRSWFENRYGGG